MLRPITDDDLHSAHAEVLLSQLIADTVEVLEQYGLFEPARSQDLTKDLLFRLCAVLDGSSFPGRLNGEEIAPFVGFYLNHETQAPLVPENGSAMHIFVSEAVDRYYSSKQTR